MKAKLLPLVLLALCLHDLRAMSYDVLVDVEPGDTSARRFAIAYDLGTTTVVATLLDLSTGTPAAVVTGARTEVDDPVGVRHHGQVMLDHDH